MGGQYTLAGVSSPLGIKIPRAGVKIPLEILHLGGGGGGLQTATRASPAIFFRVGKLANFFLNNFFFILENHKNN